MRRPNAMIDRLAEERADDDKERTRLRAELETALAWHEAALSREKEKDRRIAELEADHKYVNTKLDSVFKECDHLRAELERYARRIIELDAQLAEKDRCIADLEAKLAEAREIIQHALAWEKACTFNVRNSVVNDLNLLSACRRYRAALDDAREE